MFEGFLKISPAWVACPLCSHCVLLLLLLLLLLQGTKEICLRIQFLWLSLYCWVSLCYLLSYLFFSGKLMCKCFFCPFLLFLFFFLFLCILLFPLFCVLFTFLFSFLSFLPFLISYTLSFPFFSVFLSFLSFPFLIYSTLHFLFPLLPHSFLFKYRWLYNPTAKQTHSCSV